MYNSVRLVSAIIALLVFLYLEYPVPMIVITVTAILGYVFYISVNSRITQNQGQTRRRREALRIAKIYLKPYKDIWKNLEISNKFCSLKLGYDGVTIKGKEKSSPFRNFRIVQSKVHSPYDLWDMFCMSFNHNTTYEGLVELCRKFETVIEESALETITPVQTKTLPEKEKTDINNASEVELTTLSGISIVMAKKLIKKREEIGGFKNVEEVFQFLKLKEHMQTQLEAQICVNKMQGYTKIERSAERKTDF